MRKLKNLELVGKTRLIPGVGHVQMAAEMHVNVAVACEKVGLDWFSPPTPNGGAAADGPDSYREVTGEADSGELVTGELVTGDAKEAADAEKENVLTGTRKKK